MDKPPDFSELIESLSRQKEKALEFYRKNAATKLNHIFHEMFRDVFEAYPELDSFGWYNSHSIPCGDGYEFCSYVTEPYINEIDPTLFGNASYWIEENLKGKDLEFYRNIKPVLNARPAVADRLLRIDQRLFELVFDGERDTIAKVTRRGVTIKYPTKNERPYWRSD